MRLVLLGLFTLYGAFELGRYDAGFRIIDSVRGALSASARIRAWRRKTQQQRTALEAAEVARRVDREGYKQVERSLGDMQSQIARLNQDLSFYRGLVQPDSIVSVKVQQMQIVPDTGAGHFRIKFVLMQAGKPSGNVAGSIALTIEGLQQGKPLSLDFARVSPAGRATLAYSFKYFQEYDESVQLTGWIRADPAGGRDPRRPGFQPRLSTGIRLESPGDVGRNRGDEWSDVQRWFRCSSGNGLNKRKSPP